MTWRELTTLDGRLPCRLGQGTWEMGDDPANAAAEVEVLRRGLELGLNLIDTAEMYADAERVVGRALRGRREQAFVVTKVLPNHASRRGTVEAAERSLRALDVDVIDLYLLHWPGPHPLQETFDAFFTLHEAGKIRFFGVSNFDAPALEQALALRHGALLASNQILYNLTRREAESQVLPFCGERGLQVMAYSPLAQGRLPSGGALDEVASRHGVPAAAVALAWVLREPHVVTIPKTARLLHLQENAKALELSLDADDLTALDRAFPPPDRSAALGWT